MKKEVFIAIFVGFSLGLVITFGVYRAQKSIKDRANRQNATQEESLPQNSNQILLSITQPEEGFISDKDTTIIGGIAQKNSLITIVSPEDHKSTQADDLGNFSAEIDLDAGINQITITSFEVDGDKQEKEISVVYTTYDFQEEDKDE